jgi:hypothetical protein
MKKLNLLLCAFAMTGFLACSDDDDDNTPNPTPTFPISGVFYLTEVNTQTETDFNNDGTPHENQKLESECYDESRLVFNSDHSFTYYMNGIAIDEAAATSICTSEIYNGTWELYGGSESTGVIHATYTVDGAQQVMQLNKEGDIITHLIPFGPYPDTNSNGDPIYTTGDVTMTFERM